MPSNNLELAVSLSRPLGELFFKLEMPQARKQLLETPKTDLAVYIQSLYTMPPGAPAETVFCMQRIAVRLADEFIELKPEYDKLAADPRAILGQLMKTELKHVPKLELAPEAVVATIEAFDYEQININNRLASPHNNSLATTFWKDEFSEALRGKMIIINTGNGYDIYERNAESIAASKRHEGLHSLFRLVNEMCQRDTMVWMQATIDGIINIDDYHAHQRIANKMLQYIYDVARSEVISYTSTGEEIKEGAWMLFNNVECFDQAIDNYTLHADLQTKSEIKNIYDVAKTRFQADFCEYKEHALRLYAQTGSHKEKCEVDALLMLIPVEEVGLLRDFIKRPHTFHNHNFQINMSA